MTDREFGIIKNANSLAHSYERLLRDTSEKTQASYQKRFSQWAKNINGYSDIKLKMREIQDKWLNSKYRHTTVRQYKATFVYALSSMYEMKQNEDTKLFEGDENFKRIAKTLRESQLEELYQIACQLGDEGERKELDHQAHLEGNTSSTKDKRFDAEVMKTVFDFCGDKERYWLLKAFLTVNSSLGLRPIEYKDATLMNLNYFEENEAVREMFGVKGQVTVNELGITANREEGRSANKGSEAILIVKNAKNSHGRACGDYRFLHLDVLSDEEYRLLIRMLARFKQLHKEHDDFDVDVIRPLQNQLRYVLSNNNDSKKALDRLYKKRLANYKQDSKTNPNRREPLKKRPTLYSTRHQAVANAKKDGLHPVVIAASFGHASILTAEAHYGIRWHGSGGGVTPHQTAVNSVVERLTENQKASIVAQQNQSIQQTDSLSNTSSPQKSQQSRPSSKPSSLSRGS